jgi:hypothetical protein
MIISFFGIGHANDELKTLERHLALFSLCNQYQRQFSCLLIGDEQGDLAFEIANRYDAICILLAEGKNGGLVERCKENKPKNIMVLTKNMTEDDYKTFSMCEHIDITIALKYNPTPKIVDALLSMGDYTYLTVQDGGSENNPIKDAVANISHTTYQELDGSKVYLYNTVEKNKELLQGYWSRPQKYGVPKWSDVTYIINSTFVDKLFVKTRPGDVVTRSPWTHGINLDTFCRLQGVYPTRETIVGILLKLALVSHDDVSTHNMVIQGESIQFIDMPRLNYPHRPDYMKTKIQEAIALVNQLLES